MWLASPIRAAPRAPGATHPRHTVSRAWRSTRPVWVTQGVTHRPRTPRKTGRFLRGAVVYTTPCTRFMARLESDSVARARSGPASPTAVTSRRARPRAPG